MSTNTNANVDFGVCGLDGKMYVSTHLKCVMITCRCIHAYIYMYMDEFENEMK